MLEVVDEVSDGHAGPAEHGLTPEYLGIRLYDPAVHHAAAPHFARKATSTPTPAAMATIATIIMRIASR